VLAADSDNIARVFKRAAALCEFAAGEQLSDAVRAFTRVANISKQAPAGKVEEELLAEAAEKELFAVFSALEAEARAAAAAGNYGRALAMAAQIAPEVDKYFDKVMVMAPDEKLRDNRLRLLAAIGKFAAGVADFSRVTATDKK
jgi:glycyl-tRNA synthetase beta chain